MKIKQGNIMRNLQPIIFLMSVLISWELVVRLLHIAPWLLPAPTSIITRFLEFKPLWHHTSITILEALTGLSLSIILGISLSAGIVHSDFLEHGVFPYIVVSSSIPIIAIIPLLNIWFGFGIVPKILTAAIISFSPIVTNTTRGLKSTDIQLIDFMRSINSKPRQILVKIQIPVAFPYIFSALRIASPLSLVGAVVAELYSSDRGLGFLVITSASQLQTDLLFVSIGVLAILGIILFMFFGQLERILTVWESIPEEQLHI